MNNMMLRVTAAMVVVLVCGVSAIAQRQIDPATGLSLEQLTALAFERSPEIHAVHARIAAARGQLRQAALRPNPMVTAGRREEPGGSDNQMSLMLEVPLDLFRRAGRVGMAAATLTAVELEVANHERMFAADVRERAGAVLVAARMLSVADDLLLVTRGMHELLTARVAEGAAPPLDRDVAETEVRRLEAERAARAAQADAALIALKAMVGLSPDATLTLRDDLEQQIRADAASASPAEPGDDTIQQRADVREAAARVNVADARIRQLEREARFDLGVYGGYMRMDQGFPQRGVSDAGALERVRGVFHYVEGGGKLTLPLFNRNQGAIAAAEAEKQGAERTREARELQARAEVVAARVFEVETRRSLELFARARDLARRNVDVVRESYQLGRNTLFEVFAEQRRLVDVETAYVEALAVAFDAHTAWLRATGAKP